MEKFLSLVFVSLFVSIGYAAAGGNIAGTIQGPTVLPSGCIRSRPECANQDGHHRSLQRARKIFGQQFGPWYV